MDGCVTLSVTLYFILLYLYASQRRLVGTMRFIEYTKLHVRTGQLEDWQAGLSYHGHATLSRPKMKFMPSCLTI